MNLMKFFVAPKVEEKPVEKEEKRVFPWLKPIHYDKATTTFASLIRARARDEKLSDEIISKG